MICSVTGVILLAKLTGFVKQMLTAGLFGATLETDLILLSQTFAGNLQYLFSQVLLTAFTATYIHIHEEGGSTQRIVSDTLKVFSLTAAALMGLTIIGRKKVPFCAFMGQMKRRQKTRRDLRWAGRLTTPMRRLPGKQIS